MKTFDIANMKARTYENRDKNVFYQVPEFKTRIIELPSGGEMPTCEMPDHVVFYVVSGEAHVTVNGRTSRLSQGQCLISPPATFSMTSKAGAKIMGVQIAAQRKGRRCT
jgi:quercetin dioxygenase-like cupin family protein